MISRDTIQRGFPIRPLGDVAEFLDSRRRPITASERIPGPYPYYGANGQQDSVADYIFDEPLILLAEDGGLFDQPDRGIAYVIEGKTWVNNHAHVLRPRGHARLRYLVRVLENYDVTPWITGSTRAKLTKAGASKIQIPLPPLAEQKRIARILDAADALRAKRREALAQLDTLLQSTFLDMFGDPVTNSNIPSAIMTALVTKFIDYRGKSPEKSKEGVPLITAKIVKEKEVKEPNEFIPANSYDAWMRRGIPNPGDVVITTEAPMGEVALVPDYKAAFAQRLLVLQPDETKVKSIYLMWALTMPFVIRQLRQRSTGSTVTGIRSREFKKVTLPIPSLDLQRRFAAIVESVEQQKASQRAHLAELDTLFASLQSRAFRGDL
ncbi:restriction endonuclease subunit S [Candidatus Rariloculus sp.]|uniref:restriction endonuclease subunit S n=1 Tax=Candidatus Rariloculus sp. TaxID=3101265 RepID=UPI003D0A56A8